jgi:hypothetical protein
VGKILDIHRNHGDMFAGAFFVVGNMMMPTEKTMPDP